MNKVLLAPSHARVSFMCHLWLLCAVTAGLCSHDRDPMFPQSQTCFLSGSSQKQRVPTLVEGMLFGNLTWNQQVQWTHSPVLQTDPRPDRWEVRRKFALAAGSWWGESWPLCRLVNSCPRTLSNQLFSKVRKDSGKSHGCPS